MGQMENQSNTVADIDQYFDRIDRSLDKAIKNWLLGKNPLHEGEQSSYLTGTSADDKHNERAEGDPSRSKIIIILELIHLTNIIIYFSKSVTEKMSNERHRYRQSQDIAHKPNHFRKARKSHKLAQFYANIVCLFKATNEKYA